MRSLRRLPDRPSTRLVVAVRSRGFASQAELLRYLDVFRGPASARRIAPLQGFSVVHEAVAEGVPDEGPLFRLR